MNALLKGPYRHLYGNAYWKLSEKAENIHDIAAVLIGGGKEEFEEATRKLVRETRYASGCKEKDADCCFIYYTISAGILYVYS